MELTLGIDSIDSHHLVGVEKGTCEGVLTDDIISALKGHVKEDYQVRSKVVFREVKIHFLGVGWGSSVGEMV